MSNWKNEYRVSFHINFIHYDGRKKSIHNELIVESKTPEIAEQLILDKFQHSYRLLTDIPHGWFGNVHSKKIAIEKIKLIWKYSNETIE